MLEALDATSTTSSPEALKRPTTGVRRILFPGVLAATLIVGLMLAIPSTRNLIFRRNAVTVPAPVPTPVPTQTSLPPAPTVTPRKESPRRPEVKVWVNSESAIYHCPGSRYYGKTKQGEYMTERRAQRKGYTAASGRACQ